MPNHPSRIGVAAALLLSALLVASAQGNMPDKLRASATWAAGEKQTYRVQQVVKEGAGGREETRFFSDGTLEITAVESTADTLTFTWHRRMDNAELELVREPWGIRGNAPYDGSVSNRSRDPTPDERNRREPSNAALGIHQPLVKYDATKYVNIPRNGRMVAAWYARLATAEIEDFLGLYGRELQLDNGNTPASGPIRIYRPTGPSEVLVTLADAPVQPETAAASGDEDENDGEPKSVGLAGGALLPVAYEARIEMTLPSGWPKRAAILRTEAEGASAEPKRTTQRRVYLRQ